jgi:hypothetical protein
MTTLRRRIGRLLNVLLLALVGAPALYEAFRLAS